jgi:hypothetical protein
MAKVLFIKRDDIVRNSVLSGNVDSDKFLQFIEIAQEIHIQNYLGSNLYDKLREDIIANTLPGAYATLLDEYIQPMLIHWAMVEYLPHAAYTIGNGGAYKHSAENSIAMEKEEVDFLTNKHRNIAEHYTRRFIDYMSFNNSNFPEYNTSTNDDMHPDKESFFSGWQM